MKRVHPHSLGVALGVFAASGHALWVALIWFGGAQWLLDFIFRLHMINPVYTVAPFDFGTAATLVLVTGAFGYGAGWFLGLLINHGFGHGHFIGRPAVPVAPHA